MTIASLIPFTPIAITQSDSTHYSPPLYGLLVTGTGDVVIENEFGDEVTISVDAVPYTIWGRIRKVKADTAQADGDLRGLSTTDQ